MELRQKLVDRLKTTNFETNIQVIIGTMDGPVGCSPDFPEQFYSGTRRMLYRSATNIDDLVTEFGEEIKVDMLLLAKNHPEISKYAVYFHQMPVVGLANLVQYAKVTM